MSSLNIKIKGTLLPETSELLEDIVAVVIEALGFQAKIESSVTGNTTVAPFEHELNGSIRAELKGLISTLQSRVDGARPEYHIQCEYCGDYQVSTCEDDDEMYECQYCGHCWEKDDGEA